MVSKMKKRLLWAFALVAAAVSVIALRLLGDADLATKASAVAMFFFGAIGGYGDGVRDGKRDA